LSLYNTHMYNTMRSAFRFNILMWQSTIDMDVIQVTIIMVETMASRHMTNLGFNKVVSTSDNVHVYNNHIMTCFCSVGR
jgi:hypothetical protein